MLDYISIRDATTNETFRNVEYKNFMKKSALMEWLGLGVHGRFPKMHKNQLMDEARKVEGKR